MDFILSCLFMLCLTLCVGLTPLPVKCTGCICASQNGAKLRLSDIFDHPTRYFQINAMLFSLLYAPTFGCVINMFNNGSNFHCCSASCSNSNYCFPSCLDGKPCREKDTSDLVSIFVVQIDIIM